jgi:hypothetical protein
MLDQRGRNNTCGQIAFKIVPGGRWLLVLYLDGSVWYYDLNSEVPEQLPLDSPTKCLEGNVGLAGKLAVYVDQDASEGEFKFAVYRTGEGTSHRLGFWSAHA